MFVYLFAFALTVLFATEARRYYLKLNKSYCYSADREAVVRKRRYKKPDRVHENDYKIKYVIFFILAFFPLFFVAAVRYNVGTDYYYTYVPNFYAILEGASSYSEWGFNNLNKFIQIFTDDVQWLFVITGFVYCFTVVNTIVRSSLNPAVSVCVLFISSLYFISLNNVRQSIAGAIAFAGFPYIVDRKFLRYLILIGVACLFHISAVIMLVPYVLVNSRFIRKNYLSLAVIATAALPVICYILKLILTRTKYNYYFVSDFNSGVTIMVTIFYNLFFTVLAHKFIYKNRMNDKYGYVLLCMQFFAFWAAATSVFIKIPEMITRLVSYFQIFQLLLVPYLMAKQKTAFEKLLVFAIYFAAYGAHLVYYVLIRGYHEVIPYRWIF